MQPVDHPVHQAVVHRDHDAAAGDHVDGVGAGHVGDLAGPRARAVQHEVAVDDDLFARLQVGAVDGGDPVALTVDPGDLVVGQDLGAVGLRGVRRAPHQLPAVDRAVLHLDGAEDARVEPRLVAQGLRDGDLAGRHPGRGGAGEELVREGRVVAGAGHEVAAGGLDRRGLDAGEDHVLLRALGRRQRIAHDVASAGMQQPVESSGGALAEVGAVDQHCAVAPHRHVPHHAGPGRAATDDYNVNRQLSHEDPPALNATPAALEAPSTSGQRNSAPSPSN